MITYIGHGKSTQRAQSQEALRLLVYHKAMQSNQNQCKEIKCGVM